jgi:hypothetical protein
MLIIKGFFTFLLLIPHNFLIANAAIKSLTLCDPCHAYEKLNYFVEFPHTHTGADFVGDKFSFTLVIYFH